jgi:hypothetical protein
LLQLVAWLTLNYATAVNLLAFAFKCCIVVQGGALVARPLGVSGNIIKGSISRIDDIKTKELKGMLK